jgi:hypothetical protein
LRSERGRALSRQHRARFGEGDGSRGIRAWLPKLRVWFSGFPPLPLLMSEGCEKEYEIIPLPVVAPKNTPPWGGKFVQTLRHVGSRATKAVLIGVALGASLVFFQDRDPSPVSIEANTISTTTVPNDHAVKEVAGSAAARKEAVWRRFATHVIEELAIAFIVSGIVIFAFEWGSEAKEVTTNAGLLAHTITHHAQKILNGSATSQIRHAMVQLAGEKDGYKFANQFEMFATSIEHLGHGGWAAKGYRDFMRWYQGEVARYAESLSTLEEHVAADSTSKAEVRLVLPEATVPADYMLARLTEAMGSSGAYYALSDMFTWTKLTDYHDAQTRELERGLQIRRIFIVGKRSDAGVNATEVLTHLLGHYHDADKSKGKYRIKITSEADFKRLAAPILTRTEHFGIFEPANPDNHPLIVQVLDAQLITFRIAGAAEARAILAAFKALWRPLRPVTESGPDALMDEAETSS